MLNLAGSDDDRTVDLLFVEETSRKAEMAVLLRDDLLQLRSIGSVWTSDIESCDA